VASLIRFEIELVVADFRGLKKTDLQNPVVLEGVTMHGATLGNKAVDLGGMR